MKKIKKIGIVCCIPTVFIGQIIGKKYVIPLWDYLENTYYYANKYNNEALSYCKEYMDSTYMVKVKVEKDPGDIDDYMDAHSIERLKTYDTSRDGDYFSFPSAIIRFFYSPEYHKYFNIIDFNKNFDNNWNAGETLTMTVNKNGMNNPIYGTKDNPVPVLKWRENYDITDIATFNSLLNDLANKKNDYYRYYDMPHMDSLYYRNVKMYLQYELPKEEFNRRFKHQGR